MANIVYLYNSGKFQSNLESLYGFKGHMENSRKLYGPFIDGKWLTGNEGMGYCTEDPSKHHVATVCPATFKNLDCAIEWVETTPEVKNYDDVIRWGLATTAILIAGKPVRYECLQTLSETLARFGDIFAWAESLNRGALIRDTREFDIPEMIKCFRYYSDLVTTGFKAREDEIPNMVTLVVMTENTPLMALAWLLAPAFATQSRVLLYVPCEVALSKMLFVEKCIVDTKLSRLICVLPGNQEILDKLIAHKDIFNVVCFSSNSVVNHIKKLSAELNITKRITALTDGNTSMLVFGASDVDSAVESAVKSAWQNRGALPWSVRRLLVEECVFESVVEKVKHALDTLTIGIPYDPSTDVGPPFETDVMARIASVVKKAHDKSIEVFQASLSEDMSPNLYYTPTLLIGEETGIKDITADDISVPVLSVIPFRTAQEAISIANSSCYGLASSVWCSNLSLSLSVADKLKVGTVWVNSHGNFDPAVPVHGWKESGITGFGGKSALHIFSPEFCVNEEEVAATARQWKMLREPSIPYKVYYGGFYKKNEPENSVEIVQDEKPMTTVPLAVSKDIEGAVKAAVAAQALWASSPQAVRSQCLHHMGQFLKGQQALIDRIFSPDEISASVNFAIDELHAAGADIGTAVGSAVCLTPCPTTVRVTNEPLGVVAIVMDGRVNKGDYLNSLFRILSTALAYGNTVIIALEAVSSAPAFEMFKSTLNVLPRGVLNILTGHSQNLSEALAMHSGVDCVWYPCSLDAAKLVGKCATGMKQLCFHTPGDRESVKQSLTQKKSVWYTGEMDIC